MITEEILNLVLKLPESLCKHYLIIANNLGVKFQCDMKINAGFVL